MPGTDRPLEAPSTSTRESGPSYHWLDAGATEQARPHATAPIHLLVHGRRIQSGIAAINWTDPPLTRGVRVH